MSFLEEYMQKLGVAPTDVNRYLQLIRFLDKKVQDLEPKLLTQQKKFDLKMKEVKEKKMKEVPPQLQIQYSSIIQRQKQLYGYAKEKKEIANQLMETVYKHHEHIKTELKTKVKEKALTEQKVAVFKKNKKVVEPPKTVIKEDQFLYDNNNISYCYCNKGPFGDMVGCENPFCEKQWFHLECIGEKNKPGDGKWLCNDCLKLKEKYKKTPLKDFI